ncbi:MAG: aldehyde dehydrogenase family protein [Microbacterium sp.]
MRDPLWPEHDGLPAAIASEGTGDAAEWLPVDDPATREVIGWCASTDSAGIDRAVAAAESAFDSWARDAVMREQAMLRGADAIAARGDELAAMIVREVGKARFDADGDIGGGVHLLRTFAGLAAAATEVSDLTGRPGTGAADEVLVHRVPVGPVAVITPWNTPVYHTLNCVGPALAAGCTVVVKPAEAAPLAVTAALRLLAEQLPEGVLQIVQGTGAGAGAELTSHPRIRGVLFVGGVVAGRRVLAQAAPTVKKVSLELGGNDPALVLEDALIDDALVTEIVAGAFGVTGQVCFAIKRVYVHESRHDELVQALERVLDRLVVGPGDHEGVVIGPLTTEAGYRNALRLRESAIGEGAAVREGAGAVPGLDLAAGRYVRPAIVTGLRRDHELVIEEQFAPLLPIIPVSSDDDAVAEANRTEFGLASSVWSGDPDHARAVALRVQAGNTFVNAHRVGASVPLVPFGGVKQSGLGRNHLMHAIAECTEEHAIVGYTDAARQIPGIGPWAAAVSADTASV